jgi:hypothetical protein
MLRSGVYILAALSLLAGGSSTLDVQAVVKSVDADRRLLVVTVGQQEQSLQVPADVKVFDEAGHELTEGLRAGALQAGARITIVTTLDGSRRVMQAIRLGWGVAPPVPSTAPGGPVQQNTSGLIPLIDLGRGAYQGFPGGLYPDGNNVRPPSHEAAGVTLAGQVQPLDAGGKPRSDGKIVLLGIGFSNTVQAFDGFMQVTAADQEVNPKVLLVNGAEGGMAAFLIQDANDNKTGTKYWATVDDRLTAAGVTRAQVQVVWIKETDPAPHAGGFPLYIQALQSELANIVRILPTRFVNLKLVYLSSRTYGGWAIKPGGGEAGNSEPFSYESGFAVKWLIEQQLRGDPALNFDPLKGSAKARWLSWAAYLWTNGSTPRSDGVFFVYEDFRDNDHMHESPAGQQKVGNLLVQFFKTDPTTKPWFVRPAVTPISGAAGGR